jgi:nucleoid DNA-binding protein
MNPATKEPIQIGESTTCSFKPSQHLKDALHEPKPLAAVHS